MFAFCQQREWACHPPIPLQLRAVRVCRLRLILPHSFGSNLSCHAVIMTNKKRNTGKKLFIENDYAQGVGSRRPGVGNRESGVVGQVWGRLYTLAGGGYRVGLPVNDSMTPWS